ncbi:MAG: Gfo/Idh/MocA family protein [Phycisphaeraceae bacterium JB051]
MNPLKLGLWGNNGHSIHGRLANYPQLQLIAVGDMGDEVHNKLKAQYPDLIICETYEQMLALPGLGMVTLNSRVRADQADEILAALAKNIHVYAEKPCGVTEAQLDQIIEASQKSNAKFHEMAGTAYEAPYWQMKQLVADGVIGEVVQVLAQKSYPMHERRPKSEAIDGGLVAQNGVHAMRFVEHLTGINSSSATAMHTPLGETRPDSDLQMACHITGQLENGGLYTIIANYLNPTGFGTWGNEMVRVFGTKGMMESTDAGKRTRLVVGDEDRGSIDTTTPTPDWLKMVIEDFMGVAEMPIDLQTELHPTRMVLRAKAGVVQATLP